MSIFSQAIDDIFAVDDFIERLYAGNLVVDVSSYAGSHGEQFTEYGVDSGRTISVTCKAGQWEPSRGDVVTFREMPWKVATIDTDSHGLTITVYLKSVESAR